MLNFRFHIVSLVAVFLALAIGIIMGSTVIDRALVDTLEDQQRSLRDDLDAITEDNQSLRSELADLRERGERLASEGGERLLAGTLSEIPVLVVAARGIDTSVLTDLEELLDAAGAEDQGVLWLTDRFLLDDEDDVADLGEALALPATTSPSRLRDVAIERIAAAVRSAVLPEEGAGAEEGTGSEEGALGEEGAGAEEGAGDGGGDEPNVLVALREAGFVEYDAPEGGPDDVADLAVAGTRVVVVSSSRAEADDGEVALRLSRSLVAGPSPDAPDPPVPVLAAEPSDDGEDEDEGDEPAASFVRALREEDAGDRLSTVDNLDAFAGRLAAVVALQDLGDGRRGHYGDGPGAQRLVPSPEG